MYMHMQQLNRRIRHLHVFCTSTDVFNSNSIVAPRAQVSSYITLKHLQQEAEDRPGERCVPSAFRLFVTDKGMLCLHL